MTVKTLRWSLIALLALALAVAVATTARAQQIAFQSYGKDRGLLNLGVSCLQQDQIGYLVVCTENGLYRFDGQSFTRYGVTDGLPERGISRSFQVMPDGHVVVVASGSLYVAANRQSRFSVVSGTGPIEGDSLIRTVAFENGTLLLANDRLLQIGADQEHPDQAAAFLSASQLQLYPELQTITSVAVRGDILWLGCSGGHLCRLRCLPADRLARIGQCSDVRVFGPADGVPAQAWLTLLVDHAGTLWARAADRMLILRAGETRFALEALPGGLGRYVGRTERLSLVEGPRGSIVTQGGSGLVVRKDGRWTEIDRRQGLPDGEIAAILFDREGSLWLGLRGQGLVRAIGWGEWENWTTADGLSDNVCWQLDRRGDGPFWIATDRGVNAMSASGPSRFTQVGLDGTTYAMVASSSGAVWSANLAGLLRRFSPDTGTIDATFHVPPTDVMAIDRFGGLLLATRNGLYRMPDPDATVPTAPVLVPGTHGHIHTFAEDSAGFIWLVMDRSLVRLDPSGRQPAMVGLEVIVHPPRAMQFVAPDDLWFGSDDTGLEHVIVSDGRPGPIMAIKRPAQLSSQILSIETDRRGWVWVGTDRGLDVWNGRAWQHVDKEDGLLSDDLSEGSVFADRDGSLWFGTSRGLSHLLDPSTVFDTVSLHPVITQILLDGVPLTTTSVPWSHARLTIRFSALDFKLSDSIRFRYRLEGVDRDWVDTADTTVRYPSLPPGHLVFSVQAIEPDRNRMSPPVSFALDVRPPWWATVWFYGLVAIAVIVVASVVWRIRIRLLMAHQRQLEQLVAIRTAEIAEAHAALQAQAERDGLTGLLNRAAVGSRLDALVVNSARSGGLAVALADLDHFKSINDIHGHFGGDAVLREVSSRLADALSPGEIAGRYGGEEFVVVLTGASDPVRRLEAIRAAIKTNPVRVDGTDIAVTCSFGLALLQPGDDRETVLRRADRLLYRAKNAGRDRIMIEP